LSDFEYGIVPGVPAETLVLIRQFRQGEARQRMNVFNVFLAAHNFDQVERLLRLERESAVRHSLLIQLFTNDAAVERFNDLDRLAALIKDIGANEDESWRRETIASAISAPKMLTRLIEKK
jgi:hypothetical protein